METKLLSVVKRAWKYQKGNPNP